MPYYKLHDSNVQFHAYGMHTIEKQSHINEHSHTLKVLSLSIKFTSSPLFSPISIHLLIIELFTFSGVLYKCNYSIHIVIKGEGLAFFTHQNSIEILLCYCIRW